MKFSELSKEEEQRLLELHRKALVINALDSTISMKGLGYSDQSFLKLREGGVGCSQPLEEGYLILRSGS